jgi:hypothetical protein
LVVVIVVVWALDGLLVMEEAATVVVVVTLDALAINGMEIISNKKITTAAENKGLTVKSIL